MISFELSKDYELIKQIVTHPRIYDHITDDFSPPADQWEPIKDEHMWYVVVRDGDEVLGLWAFEAANVCWRVHTCLLPCAWGKRGAEAAKEMAQWIWQHTPCRRIITEVPEFNILAFRFAMAAGMERYGVNKDAYLKDGKLWNLVLLGMSRPKEGN